MGDTTVDTAFFIATASSCGRSPAGRFPNRSYSDTHFLFEHVHLLPLKNEVEQQMHFFILQSGQICSIQCNGFKRLTRMTELLTGVSLSHSFAVFPQAVSNPHMQYLAWVHPEDPPMTSMLWTFHVLLDKLAMYDAKAHTVLWKMIVYISPILFVKLRKSQSNADNFPPDIRRMLPLAAPHLLNEEKQRHPGATAPAHKKPDGTFKKWHCKRFTKLLFTICSERRHQVSFPKVRPHVVGKTNAAFACLAAQLGCAWLLREVHTAATTAWLLVMVIAHLPEDNPAARASGAEPRQPCETAGNKGTSSCPAGGGTAACRALNVSPGSLKERDLLGL